MNVVSARQAQTRAIGEGVALHARGDLAAAEGIYRALLAGGAPDCDALYLLGVIALQTGHADQADQVFRACIKSNRFSDGFEAALVRVLEGQGPEVDAAVRGHLRRNRFEPRAYMGTLGRSLSVQDIEPWYFSRRANPFPRAMADFDDLPRLVERSILKGWLPKAPPFAADANLLTLGSCFAEELRRYLSERGKRTRVIFVPPGLNNTFALRQFIEWCLTGATASGAYWYDEHQTGGAVKWMPEGEQTMYRDAFAAADGFVLTVGLAEVWRDTATGGVFWRGVPKSLYDETRHVCQLSTVEENEANLAAIVELLRRHCGHKPVVVTLSPVPLKATFEPVGCFGADCVSKSILRVAIDRFMRRGEPDVHYWPSFEIVKWLGAHLPVAMYGDDGNTRHVSRHAVGLILDRFLAHYFAAPQA